MTTLMQYLPRGNTLEDDAWNNRHRIVLWVLAVHLPALLLFGLFSGNDAVLIAQSVVPPAICLGAGYLLHARRPASIIVTAGLTWCSAALVVLSGGSIEAHFHFFIIIGFIALYQDWVPFLWNIMFTVISHGIGSALPDVQIFNHPAGQTSPWVWSAIHGVGVLAAWVGLVIFWRVSEEDQQHRARLAHRLAEAEISRRRFTSDLLVNLARRNQSMLYRQLDIINQLEEKERDPDALAELFRLDHLATRVRRNAESLMVLSGETPSRVWSAPVSLREVVQAAIAETEDLDRLRFTVDERLAVAGNSVTDLTHLLAELAENAVRFSPPGTHVTISSRPLSHHAGAQLLTIEDWGVGMRPEDIRDTNQLLAHPPEVDLSVSQRLGFHVVARLAQRHKIEVSLTPTPGSGVTAVVVLPAELFADTATDLPSNPLPEQPRVPARRALPHTPTRAEWTPPVPGQRKNVGEQAQSPAAARIPAEPAVAEPAVAEPPVARPLVEATVSWPSASGPPWDGWWDPSDPAAPPSPVRWRVDAERNGQAESSGHREAVPMAESNGTAHHAGRMPESPPAGAPGGGQAPGGPTLARRRPRTHLAPELLNPSLEPRPHTQIPAPRPASEALSRYQASRQAAQADADQRGRGSSDGGAR